MHYVPELDFILWDYLLTLIVPTHPPIGAWLISFKGCGGKTPKRGTGGEASRYNSRVGWEEIVC